MILPLLPPPTREARQFFTCSPPLSPHPASPAPAPAPSPLMDAKPGVKQDEDKGPVKENAFSADGSTLPVDHRAKRAIDAAEDFIKEKAWGEAAQRLQSLLDGKQDSFIRVQRD